MMRDLSDLRPDGRGRRGAGDECVLIRVAAGDPPGMRDASAQSELESVSALAAGLHDPGWVVGIR